MKSSLRASLLLGAAALMGLAAYVNGFVAVPHLQEDMTEIQMRPTLERAVSLGLHFGTFAMFGFALVVLLAGIRVAQGEPTSRAALAVIGAVYVAFGAAGFVLLGAGPHILGYVCAGLLVGVAAALPSS